MSLPELLVSMALLSVISLVTLQLYLSADTEFQHSSGEMTLSQRVRIVSDRIAQYLKTACPPNPQLSAASPFYHPSLTLEANTPIYECDFVSSIAFMQHPTKPTTWTVTDQGSAAYIGDPNNPRIIYENDVAFTSPVLRQPSLYRYRIAWNPMQNPYTHKSRSGDRALPARTVTMERLTFGETLGGPTDPDTIGSGDTQQFPPAPKSGVPLNTVLPDTGTPYSAMKRIVISPNVHLLTFTAYSSNVILMRVRIYNRDPDNANILTDGATMHRQGFGGSIKDRTVNQQRYQYVEMTTNIQIPNLTLK